MRQTIVALVVALLIVTLAGPVMAVGDASESEGASTAECEFPVTITDASGTNVTLEEEPETVVTLNPSATQTMWEIGADEKVIGLTKHATNLEGAEERTNISTDSETIDPEIVIDLEPDLVLAPSSKVVTEELVEILRDAGVTVYLHPPAESIDDVREKTRLTGELVGECKGAEETVEWMNHEIGVVESAVEGEQRPLVLYEFFGFTAGEDTFIHEIIETGGGTNLAAEVGISEYQQINEETVIDEDPDWIVLNTNSPELPDNEAYAATNAVEEDQIIVVPVEHLNRPAPRIVHAITAFAEAFHPDTYEEARAAADAAASDDATDDAEVSNDTDDEDVMADTDNGGEDDAEMGDDEAADTDDSTTDAEGTPGFGAVVALACLLLATLTAIRHRDGGP